MYIVQLWGTQLEWGHNFKCTYMDYDCFLYLKKILAWSCNSSQRMNQKFALTILIANLTWIIMQECLNSCLIYFK